MAAVHPIDSGEDRQGVRMSVENSDHRGGAFARQDLIEDLAGTVSGPARPRTASNSRLGLVTHTTSTVTPSGRRRSAAATASGMIAPIATIGASGYWGARSRYPPATTLLTCCGLGGDSSQLLIDRLGGQAKVCRGKRRWHNHHLERVNDGTVYI